MFNKVSRTTEIMSAKGAEQAVTISNIEKVNSTRVWVESQHSQEDDPAGETDSDNLDLESLPESSIIESDTYDTEAETSDLDTNMTTTSALGSLVSSSDVQSVTESLQELFSTFNSAQTVGNVKIENSTGVHIGNITNIGNIQIIHACKPSEQRSRRKTRTDKKQNFTSTATQEQSSKAGERRNAFLERIRFKIPKELCNIVPRHTWLAQSPMEEYEYIQEPVEYVIISHTATESSERQAINIRIIRDIQCFHIESREWDDIAYNFLVGCDGNVYMGRGWGVVGAHTMGYNTCSIGISFIGCFMRVLPTSAALNVCKSLLKKGVEEGHLSPNYKLVCHCQCRSTESPGRRLFEEIQTWDNFYNIENEE